MFGENNTRFISHPMTDQIDPKKPLAQQPKGVHDQVALLSFIDNLIKEKNDPTIKPEQLPNIKAALLTELNEMINTRMVTLLSEVNQRQLDALMDRNATDEELDDFFVKKIPNLSAEIASVLMDFRAAYLTPLTGIKTEEKKPANELLTPEPAPVASNATEVAPDATPARSTSS